MLQSRVYLSCIRMETLSSSHTINLPIKSTRAISQQLETYRRQLDERIRSSTDWAECETLVQNLLETFVISLDQKPLDLAIEEYKKMVAYISKYSFPSLAVIRASRYPTPFNQFNIDLLAKFKDILTVGSSLLLDQLTVDERFICRNGIEEIFYQRVLDTRIFIQHTILHYYHQLIKINFLVAYYFCLLTQTASEDMFAHYETIIENSLSINDGMMSTLQQITQIPLAKSNTRYQLEKAQASSVYLKVKLENIRGNTALTQKYIEEIKLFLIRHQAEIRQDPVMNSSFGYPEMVQYIEQITAQAIKPKKKKSKKKSNTHASTLILEDISADMSVLPPINETKAPLPLETPKVFTEWQTQCSELIQELQTADNESDKDILFVQSLQTLIAKLNLIHNKASDGEPEVVSDMPSAQIQEPYPTIWNNKQENDALEEFIEQYAQVITKIQEQVTEKRQLSTRLHVISIAIEIGIYCIQLVRDKISSIVDNIKDTPYIFMSLYFQPQLFIGKPNSSFEHFIEANSTLLVHILSGIETYASLHFSIIHSTLHSASLDIHCDETVQAIEQHLQAATYFNKQIYPELHHQQCDRTLFYILEKINYTTSYLRASWERIQNNIEEADQIEQRAYPFLQAYADLIANDTMFAKGNQAFPCPLVAKSPPSQLEIPQSLQLLSQRLENIQQTFTASLKENLNNAGFEYFYKDYLSEMEQSLSACFQIHHMEFTIKQVENMVRFARTFSYYSLSCLYEQPTPFINEKSTLILCAPIEILIKVVHTFILNIQSHIEGKEKDESTTFFNYATPLIHVLITSVIFASRTYLMLAQAIMDSDARIDTAAVKKYLKRSNTLSDKITRHFSHVIRVMNTFNYQFYYLEELNTAIRAKLEKYLDNSKGHQFLEQQIIVKRRERKEAFPSEYASDRSLTPSYGYEEFKNFLEWVTHHAKQAKRLEQPPETHPSSNKKKKPKQKTKKIAPTIEHITSSQDETHVEAPTNILEPRLESLAIESLQDNPVVTPAISPDSNPLNKSDLPQDSELSLYEEQPSEKNSAQISPISVTQSSLDEYIYETNRLPIFFLLDPILNKIFEELVFIVNLFFGDGTVYMYGGANFNENPADLDLCILKIRTPDDMARVNQLIEHMIKLGAQVPKNKSKNEYGYHDNGRHTICMTWANVKIEMTLSPKEHFSEFTDNLDYSVCAMGYHFVHKKVIQRVGLDGWADIDTRTLNTIANPIDVFTRDPSRILRGIRLIAMKNFVFSVSCLEALNILFDGERNLFLAEHIELHVLIRHLKRLLQLDLSPDRTYTKFNATHEKIAMRTLWDLKLLSKLIERLEINQHQIEPIYLEKLLRYKSFFKNKLPRYYSRPPLYPSYFFPVAPFEPSDQVPRKKSESCPDLSKEPHFKTG